LLFSILFPSHRQIYTIFHSPWANGVKSIVKNSSCDDHMTVKEGLKVSQQTRVQTKEGECPPVLASNTSTLGLQFTSEKGEKNNQK